MSLLVNNLGKITNRSMLYDAHTHLNSNELYPDWKTHVLAFIEAWWHWLVTIWVDSERNERALKIAHSWQSEQYTAGDIPFLLKTALWYHPSEASLGHITYSQDILDRMEILEQQIIQNRPFIVALGECGTDLHYPTTPTQHRLQQELFAAQCLLAKKHHLPVVVHSRDDFAGSWDVVQQFPDVRFYFHCRWYTPVEIELLLSHPTDIFVGFCGNLTYPKAQQLRDSLDALFAHSWKNIPKQLLLETDAPYLIPQQRRWQQNAPKYVGALYAYVAEYLWVTLSSLGETIEKNFLSCYQISNHP